MAPLRQREHLHTGDARAGCPKMLRGMDPVSYTHLDVYKRQVKLAHERNFCLIPFGGGTNIVGGINPTAAEGRVLLTLSLRNMNRLISLDRESRTATIQAGALGPKLEADLAEQGRCV